INTALCACASTSLVSSTTPGTSSSPGGTTTTVSSSSGEGPRDVNPPHASPVPPLGPSNPSSTSLLSPAGALGGPSTVTPPTPPSCPTHCVPAVPTTPCRVFGGGATDATPLSLHPQTLEDTREGGDSQCPPTTTSLRFGEPVVTRVSPPTPQEGDHTELTRKATNSLH
ncbi:unnamed protein product, partial [Bubo scandiacus]